MKKEKKRKIHKDKNGRDYIKEAYFVGGKMKFRRIYVIDGVVADEFYEKNATDLDFYFNGDFWLMGNIQDSNNLWDEKNNQDSALLGDNDELPF